MRDKTVLVEALRSQNVKAFLRAIRLGEGTKDDAGYSRLVGGGDFAGFDEHPGQKVWIERYQVWSSAAGAYQIILPTWRGLVREWGLKDFSPDSQDMAAVALIMERNALKYVLSGRIEEAVYRLRTVWASLPGSPHGQRTETLRAFLDEYRKHGGNTA